MLPLGLCPSCATHTDSNLVSGRFPVRGVEWLCILGRGNKIVIYWILLAIFWQDREELACFISVEEIKESNYAEFSCLISSWSR
jgi:hypothetical protein